MTEKKKKITGKTRQSNQKKSKSVYPMQKIYSPATETGSMSEGNLSNNPKGRIRKRSLHTKTFITGTDSDGQAD
jgi:hypothetical protein